MSFDFFPTKTRVEFLKNLRLAMWRMGPGEPTFFNISDEEFFAVYGDSPSSLTKNEGVWSVLVEAWGTRVYVTCPKFSGRPAGD